MSFLADFETQVTDQFSVVLVPAAAGVLAFFQPIFIAGFGIWILLIGYEVAWGKSEDGMTYLLTKVFRIFLIGSFALYAWPLFQEAAEAVRLGFINALGGGNGTISGVLELNIVDPMAALWKSIWSSAAEALEDFSLLRIGDSLQTVFGLVCAMVAYLILLVLGSLLAVVSLAMYMVAFASFELLMAVGPFFVLCMAFPFLQRFTETWTGAVMTAILGMAFTAFMCLFGATLLGLVGTAPVTTIDFNSTVFIRSLFEKSGMALLLIYLFYKIFDMASSLGGGMNMGNNLTGAVRNLVRDGIGSRTGGGGRSTVSTTNSITAGSSSAGTPRAVGTASAALDAIRGKRTMTGMAVTAAGYGAVGTVRTAAAAGRFAYNRAATLVRHLARP